MDTPAKKAIGKRIKECRELKHITQEQLAELADVSVHHISAIERGLNFPRIEKLILIINAVEASAAQIFADVIDRDYPIKASVISEEIRALPTEEQERIFSMLEFMICEAKKRQQNRLL